MFITLSISMLSVDISCQCDHARKEKTVKKAELQISGVKSFESEDKPMQQLMNNEFSMFSSSPFAFITVK